MIGSFLLPKIRKGASEWLAESRVSLLIRSFLHFSVPDEASLTDYESWIPGHGDNEHRKHADVH